MDEIILPDLCDIHGDAVRVLQPRFLSFGGIPAFGGEVVTIRCFEDNSLVAQALSTPGKGRVLVVDGGGSLRCALLGDRLAEQASTNAWAGVVIDGCVRDVQILAGIALGIKALAPHPRRSVKKGAGEFGVPVTLAGVTIDPGDFLYADNNGVIVAQAALTPPR